MFQKTVKKMCVQPGCSMQNVPVDLSLNVCQEDGAPLVEEKALDKKAVAITAIAGVVLVAVLGFGGTLLVKRWLITKATTLVVTQLSDVYDASAVEQLTKRAAGLVQARGIDEQAVRGIARELRSEAERRLHGSDLQSAIDAIYRDGVKTPEEDRQLVRLRDEWTRKYGINPHAFSAREVEIRVDHKRSGEQMQQAVALAGRGDYSGAAGALEQVTAREPSNAWALANLCAAYLHLNRRDSARAACDQAARSDPQNWLAHYNLASVRVAEGDEAEALRELELALQFLDRDPTTRVTRSDLLRQMKEDDALAKLRKDPAFVKLTAVR